MSAAQLQPLRGESSNIDTPVLVFTAADGPIKERGGASFRLIVRERHQLQLCAVTQITPRCTTVVGPQDLVTTINTTGLEWIQSGTEPSMQRSIAATICERRDSL